MWKWFKLTFHANWKCCERVVLQSIWDECVYHKPIIFRQKIAWNVLCSPVNIFSQMHKFNVVLVVSVLFYAYLLASFLMSWLAKLSTCLWSFQLIRMVIGCNNVIEPCGPPTLTTLNKRENPICCPLGNVTIFLRKT